METLQSAKSKSNNKRKSKKLKKIKQSTFFLFWFWTFIVLATSFGLHLVIFPIDPVDIFFFRLFLQINDCPTEWKISKIGTRLGECSEERLRYNLEDTLNHIEGIDEGLDEVVRKPGLPTCSATYDEWVSYYSNYDPGGDCPDDWALAQFLLVNKSCANLRIRDCFSVSPPRYVVPKVRSEALWRDPDRRNIRWSHYRCKHFGCLRADEEIRRTCKDCFNWTFEGVKWDSLGSKMWGLKQVLSLKKGLINLAVDISGGSGSFAAKLTDHNVTVVTTGINSGAPYLETIALRGLMGLHIPHNVRLPFFDNSVDLVHFGDEFHNLSLTEFEFSLFDWNRVLKPGGLMWLRKLYFTKRSNLLKCMKVVYSLKYRKHSWITSLNNGIHEFSAVLEKPLRFH